MDNYIKTNQSLWDKKTIVNQHSDFYQLEAFKQGKSSLNSIELDALGHEVAGKSMLHLQCHFGQDSISWARMGAKVTGVDFSSQAIQLARQLNTELEMDVQFLQSNVLDLKGKIDQQFDIIFTSYGVISWLPNLKEWAAVIKHYLKEGGLFYIAEFHPVIYMFDFPSERLDYDYFSHVEPYSEEVIGTYSDPTAQLHHKEYFWVYSLHETLSPLLAEGLELLEINEYPYCPYNCFENMKEIAPGKYRYGQMKANIPHVFSLKMRN